MRQRSPSVNRSFSHCSATADRGSLSDISSEVLVAFIPTGDPARAVTSPGRCSSETWNSDSTGTLSVPVSTSCSLSHSPMLSMVVDRRELDREDGDQLEVLPEPERERHCVSDLMAASVLSKEMGNISS